MLEAVTAMLENYSLENILVFIVALFVLIKLLGETVDYIIDKFKARYNIRSHSEVRYEELSKSIDVLSRHLNDMDRSLEDMRGRIDALNMDERFQKVAKSIEDKVSSVEKPLAENVSAIEMLREQIQQGTKAYIIERYTHFCKSLGMIDDQSLQMLEVRYAYYKSQGGNSYIDGLMDSLRALPCVGAEDVAAVIEPLKGGAV